MQDLVSGFAARIGAEEEAHAEMHYGPLTLRPPGAHQLLYSPECMFVARDGCNEAHLSAIDDDLFDLDVFPRGVTWRLSKRFFLGI